MLGMAAVAVTGTAKAQDLDDNVVARGVVHAPDRVDITTDLVAPIAQLGVRAGTSFQKGDVLVAFDCGRYAADLRAAKASASAAWVELKQKRYLYKNGATGRSEMDLASANSSRSAAEIDAIEERMRACTIKAPFDGRVVVANAREAELPQSGEPLMTIIDDNTIEIELVVPSHWLRHVRQGTVFQFVVDETGLTHRAEVDRLGAEVDPVSQTIQLYARFVGDRSLVLAGMSGDAVFELDAEAGLKTGAVQ